MPYLRLFVALLLGSVLASCSSSPSQTSTTSVAEIGHSVAQWQLAHMDDFDYIRTFRDHTEDDTGWVQAAFYIGLNRWYETTEKPEYRKALIETAEANDWQLGPLYWHADDQAIAQVYLALNDDTDKADYTHVRAAFDQIMEVAPDNSLKFERDPSGTAEGTCQWRWCWCDALFMAPPAWAGLSRVTNEPSYREYALDEYWAAYDYLYDQEEHLFYRDSRFFDRQTEHGNKVFWSRGNGWVFAGLPLLLEQLPEQHPDRAKILELYREMAYKFQSIQHPSGYWASSLLDVDHAPLPETSGTAFITFALAWGVNRDLLPESEFMPNIDRAWAALAQAVDEEGKLGWVQQVGNAPDQVLESDTQLYGSGALLLAASELIKR